LSSFTLGIPVFFDTVFYLLFPLGKALRRQTGKDYLLYILTIVAGATMAHSLVPPTPGPLTVAGFFGDEVSIGSMMLGGLIVGLFTVSTGIAYAYWANRRWEIPLRGEDAEQSGEGEDLDESNLPSLWFSLLPILLPVVLIAGQTINLSLGGDSALLKFLGDKNIALILSAGVAISLLVTSPFRKERQNIREAVQEALASGGVIILVTAAGSGFGAVLKDTGIAKEIGQLFEGGGTLILIPVAYLVTALVRTAQGSATVAMITAGGIIAPLALDTDLGYSALYLALAIGCGSKPISWANDSGFWVIGRMSGMTPLETFKSVSIMMILMSLVGLAVVLIGATLLPLV
jgi:GntP family gluconate:H+ symporter